MAPEPHAEAGEPAVPEADSAAPSALPAEAPAHPVFATRAEEDAYWLGMTNAVRAGAGVSPATSDSPRVRRMRVDGFGGEKQAAFLEGVAEGLTVVEAAARAGVSVATVYNFRNRREGRAFNFAWEAACRRARRPLADRLHDRSVAGHTETYRDKEGGIVGTRHRHDNRLAMAILTRLDKKAEAYREDERLITVLAEEFEELLDCIETGGDAEDFIESRRTACDDYRPEQREARADSRLLCGWLDRHRYDKADPAEIDISDLDPAGQESWTDDQWARAERSGLLDRWEAAKEDEDG